MSSEFQVGYVMATQDNAMIAQEIIYTDLRRLGMSHDEAVVYANPVDDEMVSLQYEKLKRASVEEFTRVSYLGAFAGHISDDLVALMKVGSWSHGDQMQYETGFSRTIERGLARGAMNNWGQSGKYGIHHLSAHNQLTENMRQESIRILAEEAIERCNTSARDIFIPMTGSDPAMKPLLELGFADTGKTGLPIGRVRQRLFVRRYEDNSAQ